MKRSSIAISLVWIFPVLSLAHPVVPPVYSLPNSDAIYLVKVATSSRDLVIFSVLETLKGKSCSNLALIPAPGFEFKQGLESILIHLGPDQWKGHVGELMSGDCEWKPAAIARDSGTIYMLTGVFPNDPLQLDVRSDGSKGLTLDHVKAIARGQVKP